MAAANLEPTPVRFRPAQEEAQVPDRRQSGRRARTRDRLMDRGVQPTTPSPALRGVRNVENLLLFIDDDLREAAVAMTRVEAYLLATLQLLETPDLQRAQIQRLAGDREILEHADLLNENLESLRRRLANLLSSMR